MVVLGIILGFILTALMLNGISSSITNRNRKKKCKSWKIDDKLVLNRGDYHRELEKNKK